MNRRTLISAKEIAKSTKTPVSDFSTPPLPKVTPPSPTAKSSVNDKVEAKQAAPKAVPVPPVSPAASKPQDLPSNIAELEKAVEKHAQIAVDEYNRAVRTLKRFVLRYFRLSEDLYQNI